MSVKEAADVLGVGAHTVRRLIARGTLHPLPRASSGPGSAPWQLERREVYRVKRALAVVPPVRHRRPDPPGEQPARISPGATVVALAPHQRAGGGESEGNR